MKLGSPRSDSGAGALRTIGAMALLSAFCGVLVAGLLIPVTSFVGVTSNSVADGFQQLPLALKEKPNPQRTKVLDANGDVLTYFYSQNRQDVPLKKIAPVMQQALLSIEDYRFYQHGAMDLQGTLRALVNNAAGHRTQGGSSITQQLVKMTLVQQADTKAERKAATAETVARKIRELKYAMSYEEHHTKKQILENYLNIAYFGDGAYGISAAAKHYFSVKAKNLNLTQAALLAGLVKNPVQYDPVSYPENALTRRNTVLATMERQGEISKKKANKALAAPLGLKITEFSNGCVSSKAPFFCDYVRRWLLHSDALGDSKDERQHKLETGGLTIRTTIDPRMQKATDKAVRGRVAPTDNAIGAQAVVEPGTGEVRALSQSRPMGNKTKKGQTYIDYTVPKKYGGANGFQAGSTFKAFTTAAALEKGYPASTYFYAPQSMTISGYENCEGDSFAPWSLSSSTISGGMTMTTGLQKSVNTYFSQLEKLVGLCSVTKMAKKMGLKFPRSAAVPSFTLGVTDESPLAMAAAYATFPARGEYCKPHPVTKIEDSDGKTVAKFKPKCDRVISKAAADTVNNILEGVQSPGGFGAALALSQPSAAKTGTTNENKAVWYMGYTPNLVTASMVAGASKYGEPMSLPGQTLNGVYMSFSAVNGSTLAGPMWYDAMSKIDDFLPDEDFHSPGDLGDAPDDTPYAPPPEPEPAPSTEPPSDNGGGGNGGGGNGGGGNGGGNGGGGNGGGGGGNGGGGGGNGGGGNGGGGGGGHRGGGGGHGD